MSTLSFDFVFSILSFVSSLFILFYFIFISSLFLRTFQRNKFSFLPLFVLIVFCYPAFLSFFYSAHFFSFRFIRKYSALIFFSFMWKLYVNIYIPGKTLGKNMSIWKKKKGFKSRISSFTSSKTKTLMRLFQFQSKSVSFPSHSCACVIFYLYIYFHVSFILWMIPSLTFSFILSSIHCLSLSFYFLIFSFYFIMFILFFTFLYW